MSDTGFSGVKIAGRMRDLIADIAEGVIDRVRPTEKIGKVFSYDAVTNSADILFPGEDLTGLFRVSCAYHMRPSVRMVDTYDNFGLTAPGDIVRIAYGAGQYYICDYVSGSPMPVDSEDVISTTVIDPHDNPKFDTVITSSQGNANQSGGYPGGARLLPSGWYHTQGDATAQFVADNTVTHSGSGYSLKVTLPTTNLGQRNMSSTFNVKPSDIITAKVWVRSTGPDFEFGIMFGTSANPMFFDADPNTAWYPTNFNDPADSTWREYQISMAVPAGKTRARISVYPGSGGTGSPGSFWIDDTSITITPAPPAYVPIGAIFMYAGSGVPAGDYLQCQGGTFSNLSYPTLATLVGDTFGTHSGNTYYLPDYKARSPIGIGGAATGGGSIGNAYALGQKYGHEDMPAHSHGIANAGMYAWTITGTGSAAYFTPTGGGNRADPTASAGTGTTGNVHPVLGSNFIVKAG